MNTGYFCIVMVEVICLYVFLDAIIHAIIEHRDKKEEEAATSSSAKAMTSKDKEKS